jgi:hypothetical protein
MILDLNDKRQCQKNSLHIDCYSEIFLINNCQCQNEVKNHTVPP